MAGKLDGVAARLKMAMDRAEQTRRAAEEARRSAEADAKRAEAEEKRRREGALKARKTLLADVKALALAVGLEVKSKKTGLAVSFGVRSLTLVAVDADRVAIEFDGAAAGDNIALESDGSWTITRVVDGFGRNQPLEEGLEDLLIDALGLPSPDGQGDPDPVEESPASSTAEAAPEPAPAKKSKVMPPGGALKELSNPWD